MALGDPADARPRPELTFLRRRARPRVAAAPKVTPAAARPVDYTHHSSAKAAPGGAPTARPTIDFSRPGRTPAAPAPAAPTPSAATQTPVSGGVNFRRAESAGGSLDLSSAPVAPSAAGSSISAVASRASVPESALARYRGPRVGAGEQLLLAPSTPTATLTRVQSGVGRLTVQAVCSADIGDLRLGALYQFRSGGTSTVQLTGGNRFAPSSRRPVIVASREEYEQLAFDLRQIRDIERVTVYAFSESRAPLTWGGTLVLTTFGGARIELPLETLDAAPIAVLVSLYNLAGELVVRTEMEPIDGDVREAARAYGYDRITWRDDRTPVD